MDGVDTREPHQIMDRRVAIGEVVQAIRKDFPYPSRPENRSDHAYYFSNDEKRSVVWPAAVDLLKDQRKSKDKLSVGLIVGSGAWQSILPELEPHIDILLFTDIDPRIHQYVSMSSIFLERSETLADYRKALDPLLKEMDRGERLEFDKERESLGNFHFLSSDERYTLVRQAYLRAIQNGKQFIPMELDLKDTGKVQKLAQTLKPHSEINYADLTNVAEHIADWDSGNIKIAADSYRYVPQGTILSYVNSLRELPMNTDAVVQFSQGNPAQWTVTSSVARGYVDYLNQTINKI